MISVIDKKINVGQLILSFILFLGIWPATNLIGFTFPWQYILLPVWTFVLLFVFFDWVKTPKIAKYLIALWILIIVEVIFSGVFSPLLTLGQFNFPTESANYIARLLFFVAFIVIFYNYEIDLNKFMNIFVTVLLLGMAIGVLQFFDWAGSGIFREVYSFSDRHLEVMNRENSAFRRISGVANFATATGGVASFTLVILFSMHLFNKKRFFLTLIGTMLVLFNIITAQARMGYLTVAFACCILYFVYIYVYKNKWLKSTFLLSFLTVTIGVVLVWLYNIGNPFVTRAVLRWKGLKEQIEAGGNRVGQIKRAFGELDKPFEYFFGISRGVQQSFENFYIEVEPISIFVLYGSIGFVLLYSLVLVLLWYFFKNMRTLKRYPILLAMVVASFVGLFSYVFFSGAYWFFREVYVGLFPWILMGACIGAVERFKKHPEKFETENQTAKHKKRYRITW